MSGGGQVCWAAQGRPVSALRSALPEGSLFDRPYRGWTPPPEENMMEERLVRSCVILFSVHTQAAPLFLAFIEAASRGSKPSPAGRERAEDGRGAQSAEEGGAAEGEGESSRSSARGRGTTAVLKAPAQQATPRYTQPAHRLQPCPLLGLQ